MRELEERITESETIAIDDQIIQMIGRQLTLLMGITIYIDKGL